MDRNTSGLKVFKALVFYWSAINVLLALNFFPMLPFLGWLNYGHADWATAWMPDTVLFVLLPAAYFMYWHFWFIVAIPALLGSLYLHRRTGQRVPRIMALVNAAMVVLFWAVRIGLHISGIHPDIV